MTETHIETSPTSASPSTPTESTTKAHKLVEESKQVEANVTKIISKHDESSYEEMHPRLKKILKTYRASAQKTLAGPSDEIVTQEVNKSSPVISSTTRHNVGGEIDYDNWSVPPNHVKLFSTLKSDSNSDVSHVKCETLLHGERITCFLVGGEKRLCLADILNYVLKEFTVQQINGVCEKLSIYCSRCTTEQLNVLKQSGIVPVTANSCGLITLTDAQRLCNIMLNEHISKSSSSSSSTTFSSNHNHSSLLRIYHKCFGSSRTIGLVHTHLYKSPQAHCIECEQCHLIYSPANFVTHSHRMDEYKVCHWGFDSSNWRLFIKLLKTHAHDEVLTREFEYFKAKFKENDALNVASHQTPVKRKSLNEIELNSNDNHTDSGTSSSSSLINLNHTSSCSSNSSPTITDVSSTKSGDEPCAKKANKKSSNTSEQSISPNTSIASVSSNTNQTNDHKLLNNLLAKPPTNQAHLKQQQHLQAQNNDFLKLYTKTSSFDSNSSDLIKKFNADNIIESIFDSIKKEIDACVELNEARDRLTNYLSIIQNAYNETCVQFIRSKIESQDLKQNLILENENLRTRVKYLEMETQILNSHLGVKPGTYQPSSMTSQLHQHYSNLQQQQQQQQQQQAQNLLRLYPYLNHAQLLHAHTPSINTTHLTSLLNDRNLNINTSKLCSSNASSNLSPNVTSQQQAAAIALISLNNTNTNTSSHSTTTTTPNSGKSTTSRSNQSNGSHKISSLLANKYSNVNQLLLATTTNMIKCESTQ